MTRIGQSGNSARAVGDVLRAQATGLGHAPYLVFYDDVSGERTELSYATFFNWTSKAANLLSEEFALRRGGTVALGVTTHWTGAVVAAAAWAVGAVLSFTADAGADVLVVHEDEAAASAQHAGLLVVGAGMGGRLTTDAPGLGFGDEVLAFGDDYDDPYVAADDRAVVEPARTHSDLVIAADGALGPDDRLLATAPLGPWTVAQILLAPALAGASVVWCPVQAPADLSSRVAAERITHALNHEGAVEALRLQ